MDRRIGCAALVSDEVMAAETRKPDDPDLHL